MHTHTWEALGTHWQWTLWDYVSDTVYEAELRNIKSLLQDFEATYSRFLPTSLLATFAKQAGVYQVPQECVNILRIYEGLYACTGALCTPCIGGTLEDLGYDSAYSLVPKSTVRKPIPLPDALRIVDASHIEILQPVQLDFGAVGKGYALDCIDTYCKSRSCTRYLINGSGDMVYRGNGETLQLGLEHPNDPTKVIGVISLNNGAMCSSAGNRRTWGAYHHTVNPQTQQSPTDILATWVIAQTAALADGLATCLFLASPSLCSSQYTFEYCTLSSQYQVQYSKNFNAVFY